MDICCMDTRTLLDHRVVYGHDILGSDELGSILEMRT